MNYGEFKLKAMQFLSDQKMSKYFHIGENINAESLKHQNTDQHFISCIICPCMFLNFIANEGSSGSRKNFLPHSKPPFTR